MRSNVGGNGFGVGGRDQVELVERDQGRTLGHRGVESLDFTAHRREIVFRICGDVKHIDQNAGALQMAQEADPEAEALMSAFDQSGNIGDAEAVFLGDLHAPQVRREGGERVGGYFRPRRGKRRQQGRFTGVGQPDQAGVGDQAQLQPDRALIAARTGCRDSRGAPGGRNKMHISLTAGTAVRDDRLLARHHEVGQLRPVFLVEGEGPGGHPHDEIRAVVAVLLLAAARFAIAGDQARLELEVEEGGEALVDLQNHVAAAAAVAAGGTAEGTILFAQEGNRAVAALAGLNINPGFVDKSHGSDRIIAGFYGIARKLSPRFALCHI